MEEMKRQDAGNPTKSGTATCKCGRTISANKTLCMTCVEQGVAR